MQKQCYNIIIVVIINHHSSSSLAYTAQVYAICHGAIYYGHVLRVDGDNCRKRHYIAECVSRECRNADHDENGYKTSLTAVDLELMQQFK